MKDAANVDEKLRQMSSGFWITGPIQPVPEAAFDRARSEEAYLARYADVAQAVRENAFASSIQQFELFGKTEGRAA